MEIRQLMPDDDGMLVELFGAVLTEFPEQLIAGGPASFLADPRAFVLGAWFADEPVGLAWGLQILGPVGRRMTYLHELDVREQFRRRGIGSRLVYESMALARKRGSTRFWLSTGGHNVAAQSLYESLGGERKPRGDVNFWWNL